MQIWHTLSVMDCLQRLNVDSAAGLSDGDVLQRRDEFGTNELPEAGTRHPFRILWEQFTGAMVLILLAAAGVSLVIGDIKDAVAILAIVVLFGVLGFVQEFRAERAMAALKKLSVPSVRVRRGGAVHEISARDLVPGDIVLLEAGNLLAADGRLVEAANLRVQESALTGESEAVEKDIDAIDGEQSPLGDRKNMVYMGTVVTYGRGVAVVVATGLRTELGQIAAMLQNVESKMTPLQMRLDALGKVLGAGSIAIAGIIFLIGILRGESLALMLMTAVSVAVAAVPEGLPAVVTITLALGAQRMLRRNALIRKLPAVETLGSVTVICSDKTGTLTQNRMRVATMELPGRKAADFDTDATDPVHLDAGLRLLVLAATLCNDSILQRDEATGQTTTLGDPTETALIDVAARFGLFKDALDRSLPRIAEIPFDSQRKRMTTLHRVATQMVELPSAAGMSNAIAFAKGAADGLLHVSGHVWVDGQRELLTLKWRERILAANDALASRGMRVLGVGFRFVEDPESDDRFATIESDLVFLGLVGMIDPPRDEVTPAVARCRDAGIRPVMITGDHPLTARAIARQIGIGQNGRALTGQDLEPLSDVDLRRVVADVSIFARVSPEHKFRIVEALQAEGHIVAMTGDGVNDAPALKQADIGVAMGVAGTDVSKESSEMVLRDDNFATIVAAVEEGRVIYDNIRKFIRYSVGGNIGKIIVALFGQLCGTPLPLLPLQLLWLNLLTDGLLGLGLGVEKAERNVMHRPPQKPGESVFAGGAGWHVVGVGTLIGGVSLGVGVWYWRAGDQAWQTMIFTTLAFAQIAQALAMRSAHDELFKLDLFSNRLLAGMVALATGLQLAVIYWEPLQDMFATRALSPIDLGFSIGLGVFVFHAIEIHKSLVRRRERRPTRTSG